MELRQYEYVLAVAEELHFGRAAARMHVAQQSVSEQIRRLEREIGAPLFSRTSRRVALTAVGEAFVPEARRAVDAAYRALESGRRAARRDDGVVRLGYADDLGPRLIRLILPALARRAPGLTIEPEWMSTPEQLRALDEQRLDLGFGWTPVLGADLAALPVTCDPLVAVLASGHPLAAAPVVDPADLSRYPLVLLPRRGNPALHDGIAAQLRARGAEVTVAHEALGLERVVPMVLAGASVGIATRTAAADGPRFADVVYRPFVAPAPCIDAHLVWRKDTRRADVRRIVRTVHELRDAGALEAPPLPD